MDKFAQRMSRRRSDWNAKRLATINRALGLEPPPERRTPAEPRKRERPRISFCTTCMGRLHHLRRTLPTSIEQTRGHSRQFAVLNYGSRDGLGDWVRDNLREHLRTGLVKYKRLDWPRYFQMSHAKNVAHRMGDGEILCNLDADTYAVEGYCGRVEKEFADNPHKVVRCTQYGKVAIRAVDFHRLRGYDESFTGWGNEDGDLARRARMMGLTQVDVGKAYFARLRHGDEERMRNYGPDSRTKSVNPGRSRHNRKHGIVHVNPYGYGEDDGIRTRDVHDGIAQHAGQRIQIVSFSLLNVQPEVREAQRRVFDKFGVPLRQVAENRPCRDSQHPAMMDDFLKTVDADVVAVFDVDCVPVRGGLVKRVADETSDGSIFGIAQRDVRKTDGIYAGPGFLSFRMETFRRLGSPSFVPTREHDCGGLLSRTARERGVRVKLLWPTSVAVPKWDLGNGMRFGIGTTYGELVHHNFEIRVPDRRRRFLDFCAGLVEGRIA